jgi:hypothetical protein
LLGVDIIGLFHYTTIRGDDGHLLDEYPRTVSEQAFWANAYKTDSESIEEYVARLTALVSNRMLLINPKYAKPTVCENWVLWVRSQVLGEYEWLDTERAVRLGGGFCSQHAIVFNNVLREQGIDSRILGLGGHVLNEVLIEGQWRVYDPTYNVVFGASLDELESDPDVVYQAYRSIGRPDSEAKHWQNVFSTKADNWHFRSSRTYDLAGYLIERASFFLIWFVPATLVLLGLFGRRWTA